MQRAGFTPLAIFLRAPLAAPPPAPPPAPPLPQPLPPVPVAKPPAEYVETLGAARRFHAGLRDALDVAVGQCLRKICRDVIGRELERAIPDLAAIVNSALDSHAAEGVLSIRANPRDLEALQGAGLPLIGDEALRSGDIELVLRSGTIDLALEARLETALALWNG